MDSVSVNQFRDNLKAYVEQATEQHQPLKVTRRNGEDFIVVCADDWQRQQETLYILQNSALMQQIAESSVTHQNQSGDKASKQQLDEILSL